MRALLVTYHLKQPIEDYKELYSALKEGGTWWHYLDSTWLIITDLSPRDLYEKLVSHIWQGDRMLIIEVKANYWGTLPKDAWEWIENNVKQAQYY